MGLWQCVISVYNGRVDERLRILNRAFQTVSQAYEDPYFARMGV
jgi:hypothetical protein